MADPKKEEFAGTLKALLWNIHELESTICDYDGNQDVLHDRVSQLAANLRTLASQRDAVDLYIPMELLRYLDDGGNPDSFTTEAFERAQEDNQLAKGRIDALQKLQEGLAERLASAAPEIAQQWRAQLAAQGGGANGAGEGAAGESGAVANGTGS